MKKLTTTLQCLLLLIPVAIQGRVNGAAGTAGFEKGSGSQPLLFTENRGQVSDMSGAVRPDILFTANSSGAKVYITGSGIQYQFEHIIYPPGYEPNTMQDIGSGQTKIETHRFALKLKGANPSPRVRKEAVSNYTESFYLAHCPQGITNVPTYGRIVFEAVYPGIDWVVYSNAGGLKYDFIVHPGANPSQIALQFEGADAAITSDGGLLIKTQLGELREGKPVSFSAAKEVQTIFEKDAEGIIKFKPGSYDKSKTLTIDPCVTWATYYGGSGGDIALKCMTNKQGGITIAGATNSVAGIATSTGFQIGIGGNTDIYLVRFDSTGARQWATYYGGGFNEIMSDAALDTFGNIVVTGNTNTTSGFSTMGSHQPALAGLFDAFLVKFNNNGTRLWATYLGGDGTDLGYGCCTDNDGNIFIAGTTYSDTGIATPGAFLTTRASTGLVKDAFLVKFDANGVRQWGTYFGGTASENGYNCATNTAGDVYLVGDATSTTGIATGGSHQSSLAGGADCFIAKFNSSGSRQWSTYYGGSGGDVINECIVDGSGNLYITGSASSAAGIATSSAYQATIGGFRDAFLAKFDASGARQWGTYLGGPLSEESTSCTIDVNGDIYIAGYTTSTSGIATANALQYKHDGGSEDGLIAKFTTSGSNYWASYYGESGSDNIASIAHAGSNIYLCGSTSSNKGLGTNGSHQQLYGGGTSDAFLTKLIPYELFTDSIAKSNTLFCPGDTMIIPFRAYGTFKSGNVYTVELSDSLGAFGSPILLAALTSTSTGGIIPIVLPQTMSPGTFYRIRVVASSPICFGRDNGTNLNVVQGAPIPVISYTNGDLVSNIGGIRWYNSGTPIFGATAQTYHPTVPGDYYAETTNAYGCKGRSNVIHLTATKLGVNAASSTGKAVVYPNPTNGELSIDLSKVQEGGRLSIYSPTGAMLLDKELKSQSLNRVDLAGFSAGVYFVLIRYDNGLMEGKRVLLVR